MKVEQFPGAICMSLTPRDIFRQVAVFGMMLALCMIAAANDFDGDRKADPAMFRPSTGVWYLNGAESKSSFAAFRWGVETDVLVPGDYDGDREADIAVWRPENGNWHIRCSGEGQLLTFHWGRTTIHPTGGLADVPVTGDYDGDGLNDIAVWRPDSGEWLILMTSKGYNPEVKRWGMLGDVPVQADYDGDGSTDIAVFRPMENRWYILESKTGNWQVRTFGRAGDDLLVPADYTGDGKADLAVYDRGNWTVLNSETQEVEPFEFGFADAIPVPADYDGDGVTDFAVYEKGKWFVYESDSSRFKTYSFGRTNDVPVNSLAAKQSIVAVP